VVGTSTVTLDVPAQLVGGRTMVPLRFVYQALEAEVAWDPAAREVRIAAEGVPAGALRVTAVRVVDGDTLEMDLGGLMETVRLISGETPKTVHP